MTMKVILSNCNSLKCYLSSTSLCPSGIGVSNSSTKYKTRFQCHFLDLRSSSQRFYAKVIIASTNLASHDRPVTFWLSDFEVKL